jgi:acetyltransferase-like isoleucine patch superfamily enzyme
MNENIPTTFGTAGEDGRLHLEWDWYAGGIPANVEFGRDVYIDTSYGFAACFSELKPGVVIGDATGAYDRASFVVGPAGRVRVGQYTILNGTYLICNNEIMIGNHCLLAWGSVITDTWTGLNSATAEARRAALRAVAADPLRRLQPVAESNPIKLEDNTWVGFDSVILPGVTLGRGCIVGSKTVIYKDVPPYAVVVGDPARIIRYLDPDDTEAQRVQALQQYAR